MGPLFYRFPFVAEVCWFCNRGRAGVAVVKNTTLTSPLEELLQHPHNAERTGSKRIKSSRKQTVWRVY
jgi:hypothetical protein